MGVGLGKNSPVVLSLGKDNYEALIQRHGQWLRWRTAKKCSCVSGATLSPDIHCKACGGRGWVYDYQKEKEVYTIVCCNGTHILTLTDEYAQCALVGVYDFENNELKAIKEGCFVVVDESVKMKKGEYYTVVLTECLTKYIESAEGIKSYDGEYTIDLTVSRRGIDGLFYTAPCDILSVERAIDEDGNERKVIDYRLNKVFVETKDADGNVLPLTDKITLEGVKYLEPSIFVLLSQGLSERDAEEVVNAKGDAVVSFPYNCLVAEGDVLTVLAGSYVKKEVIQRSNMGYDVMNVYFVQSVISLTGKREHIEGEDYVIMGTNKIKWLCDDEPETNSKYSITYNVRPTYTVVKAIPQLRTSENQRMPKKAVVRLMASYSENAKVNRQ